MEGKRSSPLTSPAFKKVVLKAYGPKKGGEGRGGGAGAELAAFPPGAGLRKESPPALLQQHLPAQRDASQPEERKGVWYRRVEFGKEHWPNHTSLGGEAIEKASGGAKGTGGTFREEQTF